MERTATRMHRPRMLIVGIPIAAEGISFIAAIAAETITVNRSRNNFCQQLASVKKALIIYQK
jgi:hypothetical protein